MDVKMTFPPDFDRSKPKKYPVLMYVYGGPFSRMTTMKFDLDYSEKVANLGVISISVDGRGTANHGIKFRSSIAKQLGKLEAEDQIFVAKWLSKQSYVDKSKIGIWGWSFGGYLTCKVVEANSGDFSLAMSVAPVTDWRYYDTMYTERYLKTTESNSIGYDYSAVTKMEGFRHVKFLLLHGTADG